MSRSQVVHSRRLGSAGRDSAPGILDRVDLGAVLREARDGCELTLRELAGRTGYTVQALSRWERGDRPVRSDVADRILAACGRDVRLALVDRHEDIDTVLTRLAGQPVAQRMELVPQVLTLTPLHELQQTGAVVFSRAWAAAALGLPPLHDVGGLLVLGAHEEVTRILGPHGPLRIAPGGPWGTEWDVTVLTRHPHEQWRSMLIGDFTLDVVTDVGLERQVSTPQGGWRVIDPARLAPVDVDEAVLGRWRVLLQQP